MESKYYNLQPMLGKDIIELRELVRENDVYLYPIFYDIEEIQPDKYYMASIIDEDLGPVKSIYKEEIIYEIKKEGE